MVCNAVPAHDAGSKLHFDNVVVSTKAFVSMNASKVAIAAMTLASLAGCGFLASDDVGKDNAAALEVVKTAGDGRIPTGNDKAAADSGDLAATADKEATPSETGAAFEPPFPERTNLFARPNAQKAAGLVRKRQEVRGGDLLLKGFVNVGRPKAMLQMDGKLWIAGEGETRDDVSIVSVAPPKVSVARSGNNIELSLHQER